MSINWTSYQNNEASNKGFWELIYQKASFLSVWETRPTMIFFLPGLYVNVYVITTRTLTITIQVNKVIMNFRLSISRVFFNAFLHLASCLFIVKYVVSTEKKPVILTNDRMKLVETGVPYFSDLSSLFWLSNFVERCLVSELVVMLSFIRSWKIAPN